MSSGLVELLARLRAANILIGVDLDGRLTIDAPGPLTDELFAELRARRTLIAWTVAGRGTGHCWAACSTCGEESLTAVLRPDGRPRTEWPHCYMTPRCPGRHVPAAADIAEVEKEAPPAAARPPASIPKARLCGPTPPWPTHPQTERTGSP